MGIMYESIGDAEIRIGTSPDGVSIVASRDGLRSLLHLIENLQAAPSADHIHLTPSMQLATDSEPLVVSCTEPGTPPKGFPANFDQMSLDARRIWRLEAQLLHAERLLFFDAGRDAVTVSRAWIWEENVPTLLETVSRWIGYAFDESDWTAIADGLSTSDVDKDRWYSYPLVGTSRIDVELARNLGDVPVSVKVTLDRRSSPGLASKVNVLLELLNQVRVNADRGTSNG